MTRVIACFDANPGGSISLIGDLMLPDFIERNLLRRYAPAFKVIVERPDGQRFTVRRRA